MRNIALLGLGAFVALSFAGTAMADTMSETFGNTVLSTNDKGETTKVWFKADSTYAFEDSKGVKGSGRWVLKDGQYCDTPNLATDAAVGTPAPKEMCFEYQAAHKVGDKWSQKNGEAKTIKVEIKKGT